MPEHLPFEEIPRNGGTIDADEPFAAARTQIMDPPGEVRLPYSRLTLEEHRVHVPGGNVSKLPELSREGHHIRLRRLRRLP
jgi:hypothetical protein